MYVPAPFREDRPEVLQALVRAEPLGLWVTQDIAGELIANNLPFMLDIDARAGTHGGLGILRAHVARANPVWREARTDRDCLVAFQGAQAYVSPSLYPSKAEGGRVVPTWNYIVVQARGRLRVVNDADWLRAFVTRLTDRHEAPRAAPWAVSDAPADHIAKLLRAIVGIEIVLTSLTGKWKTSQNLAAADRAGVVRGLADAGIRFEAFSPALSPAPDLP